MEKQSSIVKGKTIKQVRKINLSGLSLTEIPAEVFQHTNLTKLVLSRNAITRIPKEISKLKKLEVLDLTYNELDSLPAPVFKLPKLRVLAVGHNKLKKFPAQIVGSSIKELIADHNRLQVIEPEALDGLRKLVVSNNPLSGQIVTHLLPELEYYDFWATALLTPPAEMLPVLKKGKIPVHPAEITPGMVLNKMVYDAIMSNEKGPEPMESCESIFISHSSKDKEVIDEFVEQILQLGMGIPQTNIFCTSIEGMGIENGAKMRDWIHEHIKNCDLAFLMISPNYKVSEICLNEMGAIWALNKQEKILLLPGVDFKTFGWLEEIRQAGRIEDDAVLDQLHDELSEKFGLEKKSAVWGSHKKKFIKYCENLLPGTMDTPQKIAERDATDRIYLGYCNKVFALLRYKSYNIWTEMLTEGHPRIPTELISAFDELVPYLDSRAKHSGYERFDKLFEALSLLIDDFSDVFIIYSEGKKDYCSIRPFYKDEEHNGNYYQDRDSYISYVNFIKNMVYELTRLCNAILSEARKLMVDYMSDFGVFAIDGISHKGSVIVKFEYEEGELYSGLKDYIDVALKRKFHSVYDKDLLLKVIEEIVKEK